MSKQRNRRNKREQEPELVPFVKAEPVDVDPLGYEGDPLKIVNVFSIKSEPGDADEPYQHQNTPYSDSFTLPKKSKKRRRATAFLNDTLSETYNETFPGTPGRYRFRDRAVVSYDDSLGLETDPDPHDFVFVKNNKRMETQVLLACELCSLTFTSQESLEEHVIDVHVVDKEFNCSECSKSFICEEKLELHMIQHTADTSSNFSNSEYDKVNCDEVQKPFKCYLCSKSFSKKGAFAMHIKSCGRNTKRRFQFKCPKCQLNLAGESSLRHHQEFCPVEKATEDKNAFLKVGSEVSTRILTSLQEARDSMKIKSDLRKHAMNVLVPKTVKKKFRCPKCNNKTFSSQESLRAHKIKQHKKPAKVPALKKGKRKDPIAIQVHRSDVCEESFKSVLRLKKHAKVHKSVERKSSRASGRGTDLVPPASDSDSDCTGSKREGNGRFKCPHCDKSYVKMSGLGLHLSTHFDTKCDHCGLSCKGEEELKKHIVYSHGERRDEEFVKARFMACLQETRILKK